ACAKLPGQIQAKSSFWTWLRAPSFHSRLEFCFGATRRLKFSGGTHDKPSLAVSEPISDRQRILSHTKHSTKRGTHNHYPMHRMAKLSHCAVRNAGDGSSWLVR